VRLFTAASALLTHALAEAACNVKVAPMLANGRIELMNFLREVSFSCDYHRYGNLGPREHAFSG
jgi:RHH-type proline utilization regulon transcriptional repressor/proline dehydrogenase/delta 1-pyrroline-5-carboxylate dehydrogenase